MIYSDQNSINCLKMSNAKSNEKEKSKVKFVDEEKMMFIELVAEFWPIN